MLKLERQGGHIDENHNNNDINTFHDEDELGTIFEEYCMYLIGS